MRTLILIGGYIHDVSSFVDHHPGGKGHLLSSSGKDKTSAFFGGIYSHSNAAHNVRAFYLITNTRSSHMNLKLLSMMRVGVLDGGMETLKQPERLPVKLSIVLYDKD